MYVYQNGKLYLQDGEKLVGVEIYFDKVLPIKGTETKMGKLYELLTKYEVMCKFHIAENPYIFPQEVKKVEEVKGEVELNEPVTKVKKPARRKSTSK